jgi:hypothetical protein
MHYLFFDESYSRKNPGKIVFAGWAVEQDRLSRRLMGSKVSLRSPVLNAIDAMLEDLDAWAIVARACLDPALFRSGEVDGTDDVARMSRTDNVWATCSIFLVNGIISGFYKRGEGLATVDVYHDPKTLTSAHDDARRKTLRGFVVRHAKEFSAARGSHAFKKLNIRRIERVGKPLDFRDADKFQVGVWVSHRLCSRADVVEAGQFSRIRTYDMSEEVRRTIQQWDGKGFEDD